MVDWKTYKGQGPWLFAEQRNKWGYLNNPRWMNPSGAPVSYDGRINEEPQIWTPEGNSHKDGQDDHFPCGHWHKVSVSVPTTAPPILLLEWFSCPMTALYGNGTDDIFFMTTDHDNPTATYYIVKYNRTYDTWSIVYTETAFNDPVLGVDFRWFEPEVARAFRNSISAFGSTRPINDGVSYYPGLDIKVFNNETLLSNSLLDSVVAGRGAIVPAKFSHWLTFDNSGRLFAVRPEYSSPTSYHYVFRSDNNGVSWTPYFVFSGPSYNYRQFITVDSSNNLWVCLLAGNVYRSTDHGVTWNSIGVVPVLDYLDFTWLNDALFVLYQNGSTAGIRRSTDGSTWNTVLNFSRQYYRGGALAFNGTYYFAIFNFRNAAGNVPGYNMVYRSSDGVSWSLISYFYDDSVLGSTDGGSYDISVFNGKLLLTYYYASTLYITYPDVYAMCVWESSDNGVTWNNIQTPFIDLTTGVWPYLPVPLTGPPPSTAAPTPAPTTAAPTTLPPTTLAPLSDTWRINVSANNGGSYINIAEMQMMVTLGGADQCSGGTPSASSNGPFGLNPPANAFDNSLVTRWSTNTGLTTGWLQYVFASYKTIVQYTLSCGTVNLTSHPNTWTLEYWDGGSWQVVDTQTGITWLSVNETKTFNVP